MRGAFNELVGDIASMLPQPNDDLLSYKQRRVDRVDEHFASVFHELSKIFDNEIKFKGFELVEPEQRKNYELYIAFSKDKVETSRNELALIKYIFEFENHDYTCFIHVPYMMNNTMYIKDTSYHLLFNIAEPCICNNGPQKLSVDVMRGYIKFTLKLFSFMTVDGHSFQENMLTVNAYQQMRKSKSQDFFSTPILYLFAEMGVRKAFEHFNFSEKEITFVDSFTEEDKLMYYIFECKQGVYIRVLKQLMKDSVARALVSQMCYTMKFISQYHFSELFDDSRLFWKALLGKSLNGQMYEKQSSSISRTEAHLPSFKTYLDDISRYTLRAYGFDVKDTFELLEVVMKNVYLFMGQRPNDLFCKRITVEHTLFYESINDIFRHAYNTEKRERHSNRGNGERVMMLTDKKVIRFINGLQRNICKFSTCPAIRMSPSLHGDNLLFGIGAVKSRRGVKQASKTANKSGEQAITIAENVMSSPHYKLDPSYAVIESPFSTAGFPGIGGTINVFAQITEDGRFIKPEWFDELDQIRNTL